jgi:hypothetical protein
LSPFRAADDADGVVDPVVLRSPSAAELEGRDSDRQRGETRDDAVALGHDLAQDGRSREHVRIRVAALCADPALVRRARGTVRCRRGGERPALLEVDA